MITRSQMSSATLGSKNEEGTRKRKRPDSLGSKNEDKTRKRKRPDSLGLKNEEGTRKRKRPDILDIDVDRSNENGSLPGISIQSTEKSDETWKETSIQKSAETWTGTFARTFASICRIFSKDEDIMDRSKESQSRPGSVQRNRIARTQEDAESTIPTGRLSPSLFPKEDGMDLSKQQSRQEIEHIKKIACKRHEGEVLVKMNTRGQKKNCKSTTKTSSLEAATQEDTPPPMVSTVQDTDANIPSTSGAVMNPVVTHRQDAENTLVELFLFESPVEYKSSRVNFGENRRDILRNCAKEGYKQLVGMINTADDKPVVWAPPLPPPPPDPPNPN